MHPLDDAALAARVARQPGVAGRVHDLRVTTRSPTAKRAGVSAGRSHGLPLASAAGTVLGLEHPRDRLRRAERMAGRELVLA